MTSCLAGVTFNGIWRHRVALKFNLNVSEYLKGAGPSNIVVVWVDGWSLDAEDQANNYKAELLAERDAQWDDREAIIFLRNTNTGLRFGKTLQGQLELEDHFFLARGAEYPYDDLYSLYSEGPRKWLPAAPGSSGGDDTAYLLAVPPQPGEATGENSPTPTITLGDLRQRIQEVTAEYNGGDGSEAYKECIRDKYETQKMSRFFWERDGRVMEIHEPADSEFASGRPAGAVLHQRESYGLYPSQKAKMWLEGQDAALFSVAQGETNTYDTDEDGKLTDGADWIGVPETFTALRPLPAGTYKLVRREVWAQHLICDYAQSLDWTVTVTAPTGTLHELFFDPVTVGSAIAADAANGTLEPQAFMGVGGVSADIGRISYESSAVKLKVTPVTALAGHVVDVIELNGGVSLSLNVASATVDTANNTLNWPVSLAPWENWDKLMVRVHAPLPPTPMPNTPADLTVTAGDMSATLSWSEAPDYSITSYEYEYRVHSAAVGWGAWTDIPESHTLMTSYEVTGLTNGTEYRFQLRAVSRKGSAAIAPNVPPGYVAVTPRAAPPTPTPGPAATPESA